MENTNRKKLWQKQVYNGKTRTLVAQFNPSDKKNIIGGRPRYKNAGWGHTPGRGEI